MIPEAAVEAAAEFLFIDYSVTPYYREQLRAALEAAAPHTQSEHEDVTPVTENEAPLVSIPRALLEGWPITPPLTGTDWRNFAESLPASEFATTLLHVADGIDRADGTGWYARDSVR